MTTRREFLRATAGASAALMGPRIARGASGPRVAIVGAGLAGLTTAYELWSGHGIQADVYEAQARLGGRAWTTRGLPGGQWIEHGGSFISTGDDAIRHLAGKLGVGLIDTLADYPAGGTVYRFGGTSYPKSALKHGLDAMRRAAEKQAREVARFAAYDNKAGRSEHFDHMSVADWIDRYCPGGLESLTGRYYKAYFESEYSARIADASGLMPIYDFESCGGFDERYIVNGGTDTIVSELARRLPAGSVHTEMALTSLRPATGGGVTCTFALGSGTANVTADYVVLALPFTVLRGVELSDMSLGATKSSAIRELGMGADTKLNLQFDRPAWEPGSSGDAYTDLSPGGTFPGHVGQPGAQGIGVALNVVDYGATPAHGGVAPAVLANHLAALDQLFPGISGHFDGQATLDNWPADPWVKGSYSFYKVGQMTGFGGVEAEPRGRMHFAGEHTARYCHRSTLNGAVESGLRAAREVARATAR